MELLKEAWSIGSLDYGARADPHRLHGPGSGAARRPAPRGADDQQRIRRRSIPICLKKNFATSFTPPPRKSWKRATDGRTPGRTGARRRESRRQDTEPGPVHGQSDGARQQGKIDPVLGRDFEIRQIIDILTRRRQNNPILTGEAGVGKTAVVEGFAHAHRARRCSADVLKNVTLRTLDLALLQAGAGVKGEFENRLKGLIEEVKNSQKPIILFIDEAHTMIGAGGAAGQGTPPTC